MLETDGHRLHPAVFTTDEMARLALHLGPVTRAGRRSLLEDPEVQRVANDARVRGITGAGFFAVRALLFDKTAASNWGLRWHQDLSIAVRAQKDAYGFGPWSSKDGVPHALAPVKLLSRMVTLRIHLDDCTAESGPLQVIPGSHSLGRLDGDAVDAYIANEKTCVAACGDVLAFKPLLLHASASSTSTAHRRVLQLEFACDELPDGLEWRWRV